MDKAKFCAHCKDELGSYYDNDPSFCCAGCRLAYEIINKLDLYKYYEYCKKIYNKNPMKIEPLNNELDYNECIKFLDKEQLYESNLSVEGVQCGSCVWLIENALKREEGIIGARINLSTNHLLIKWSGDQSKFQKYLDVVQKLGYKLLPYNSCEALEAEVANEYFLLKCIAISGFATIQLMMISMGIWAAANNYFDMGVNTRKLLHLLEFIIGIPSIAYSSLPFLRNAWIALKARRSNMDIPISLGIIATTLISVEEYFFEGLYTYFDSASMLILALLAGRYLDLKARTKAKEQARQLLLSQAQAATRWENGILSLVSINKIKVGDIVYVSIGEKIPVDGILLEGKTEVDNSKITGETIPQLVREGEILYAGSINMLFSIKLKVTKIGENTVLAEISRLMENAEQCRAKFIQIADKVAALYSPIVFGTALLTLIGWLLYSHNLQTAFLNAVAVLIITCPCALGLAVPVVNIIASGRLIKGGILIKTKDAFERLAGVKSIVFDKTGTLTVGKPQLLNPQDVSYNDAQLLVSVARHSKHPLAAALHNLYEGEILDCAVKEEKGKGLVGSYNGCEIRLGNFNWCGANRNTDDSNLEMWYRIGDKDPVRLIFKDQLRDDAKLTISKLYSMGYRIILLSGDRDSAAQEVAKDLGIKEVFSEQMPNQKYTFLEELDHNGWAPLMIGDGLNDAPALKRAHASISPSSALDMAQNAADIVFQQGLLSIPEILIVAKKAELLVKQNLSISLIYNIMSIPIAAFGYISPIIAALAMSLSSICVVLNSMRMKK